MTTKPLLKIFSAAILLTACSLIASAQKIQNVQETSVWAIAPVKVDGKTSDETFQAFNKSTSLFYTISNDDKNIYLVVKSADLANTNKIMMGGITLSINTAGKKKEKESFAITYPVIARPQRGQGGGMPGMQRQQTVRLTGASADSAASARRKQQLAAAKEIKVLRFKDITDSLISIYNEYGIIAAANIDDSGAYVYELAVPLNLLGLTLSSKDFSYNIKLNGIQFGGGGFGGGNRPVVVMRGDGGGGGGGFGGGGGGGFGGGGGGRGGFDPAAFLPTDFWAKYTLAKN